MLQNSTLAFVLLCCAAASAAGGDSDLAAEVRLLRERVDAQQKQIDKLRAMIEGRQRAPEAAPARVAAQAAAADLDEQVKAVSRGLAGFRFSGDFRLRLDAALRSGNEVAGPLQNVRSRYRLRLNADKDLDRRFSFRMQLSTGAFNSQLTTNQDMGTMGVRHPFSLSEAWVDFHPNRRFSMRGGRMEEVFADGTRFLWDDDLRLNGFHQIARVPLGTGLAGFQALELRAGQYFLSNPGVYVLSASSPFVAAGYEPGRKVRTSNLFHPGFVLSGAFAARWAQTFTGDISIYRNPDQIQLASTPAGVPVLINNGIGLQLSGPLGGTGTAAASPGGAMYSASNFQIVRMAYRLERKGVVLGGREMPAWVDLQASRNVGAGSRRDAMMASANLGNVRRFGDMRFLYQFAIKDANALISQFTDDDLGTGSGVNVRTHALRFDFGLTRFLQIQNLLFLQEQLRGSNPAERFFVPLPRGAGGTLHYLGHLAFTF